MRLTLEKISQADLVLFLLDASRPLEDEDFMIRKSVSGKPVILVRNKTDLVCNSGMPEGFQENQCVDISALTGAGVDNLKEAIFSKFIRRGALDSREFTALSQMRHRDALERAKRSLKSFLENVMGGVGLELLAIDLREALTALGEITGETTPDEILDQIFQRFCIGK